MNLDEHLTTLETNALALRNIADKVLGDIGQIRSAAQLPVTKKKQKSIDKKAGMAARLLSKAKPKASHG